MCVGTLVARQCLSRAVCDMCSVIWAVQVLSIPARREDDSCTDTASTHFGREGGKVVLVTGCSISTHEAILGGEASVADVGEGVCSVSEGRVAGEHSEALD